MLKLRRIKLRELALASIVQRPELYEQVQRYATKLSTDDIEKRLTGMTVLQIDRKHTTLYVCDNFFVVKALQSLHPDLTLECCVKTVASVDALHADILRAIEVSMLSTPHAAEISAFLKANDAQDFLRHKDYAHILSLTPAALHANCKKYRALQTADTDKSGLADKCSTVMFELNEIPPVPREQED